MHSFNSVYLTKLTHKVRKKLFQPILQFIMALNVPCVICLTIHAISMGLSVITSTNLKKGGQQPNQKLVWFEDQPTHYHHKVIEFQAAH